MFGTKLNVQANVNAPIEKVWEFWTAPEHITQWCFASPDWHTPKADNDLRVGGHFSTRMEAKDGSFGFDFGGVYDLIEPMKTITYTLDDTRKVEIHFTSEDISTQIVQQFEAEGENPEEMQQAGWQAIMDSFKAYAERQ